MLRSGKGGVILHQSVTKLIDLLPFPAANLLCYCFSTFKNQLTSRKITVEKQHAVLNALPSGATCVRLNNLKEVYTARFHCPPTGYSYIAFNANAFR